MFNNASNIDASHSTFSEVHRDQHLHSRTHVQGNYTVNTIVHGNQVVQGTLGRKHQPPFCVESGRLIPPQGLENLYRASVASASFDAIDRHPAPACLPGTRLELLARVSDWVDDPSRDHPVCWLSGLAGSGKSAVAQSIAEKYAGLRRLAASFFFSRKEILRRKAQGFFPTLACQLLVFAPSIKPALLETLDADATIPTKVLLEQARKLLQEPIMSSSISFPDPVLIVVDSLDECDDVKMVNEIVHLLTGISRHCPWALKVLFTSRTEPHIVQTFQDPVLQGLTRSLQLQNFDVDGDIRTYLHHSFEGIRKSMVSVNNHSSPWPSEGEIEMIVQKAAGLFIFATTVVKYVALDYGSPVMQLQAVLLAFQNGASAGSALVHSPLDTLYLDALRRIPDVEKVRSVLGLVVFAFRPLSTLGLNDLLWNFRFDTSYILKHLSSVLMISDSSGIEGDGSVHIYHTSFRDFLTSSHRSQQYFVDSVAFHSTLARACLELMLRYLTVDMCSVGDPSIMNSEIEDLGKRCRLSIKEGVRYACRWFAHHLSQVPWDRRTDDALVLSLRGFASQYLLNWIEVLSLTGELNSAVLSLREVVDWLKRSPSPHEEALSLFRDAERLVLMCYDSIQQAALQVYYSLPCVPTHTQIRTTYTHELKDKYVITHGLDDHWKSCLRSVSTGATIKSLAISSSGRLIASAGDTPGVQLWDTITGNNTGHFCGSGTSSCPVGFSPSGDHVAIGYDTGMIDIWDVATGQRLLDPTECSHQASVMVLAFSPNGLFIASAAANATVHVWDMSTRGLKHSIAHQEGSILCLTFSSSNGLIASGSDDASITTSDVHSGKLVRKFLGHTSRVNSIAFSTDSESIASGSDDRSVRLWDTRTGVCLRTFAGLHKRPVYRVWITTDNKHVVSVCNMDIYMWETGPQSRRSPQHVWSVNRYFKKAAAMFPAWYAKLVKFVPSRLLGRLCDVDDGTVLYVTPSPDGMTIGCTYGSSVLFLECSAPQKSWSRMRHSLTIPSTMIEPPLSATDSDDDLTAIAMTLDTTLLVTSADNGVIKMWNTSPRSNWKTFQGNFKRMVDDFWPGPDGRSLLVKPMVGLQLMTPTGALIRDLETGGDGLGPTGAVPSPDSRYFAYWAEYPWNVDESFSIHIYNASTGVRLKRIPGFFNITCGRFSANGDYFACVHGDGIVQIWELPSVVCKTTITTGHAAITALEWLPGNVALVVGSDKGRVEIRLVEGGDVIHFIECLPSMILALAVPNEAIIVVVGHEDGSLFVWDPSYTNVVPHCLSKETSDGAVGDPDGVDFIKFVEGHRSICTRSLKGVICTWDLTRCLAEYAKGAKEPLREGTVANIAANNFSTFQPSDFWESANASNESASATALDSSDATEATVDPADSTIVESSSLVLHGEASEPEITALSLTAEALTTPDASSLTTTPPTTNLQCPHLVSRSDAHIIYDRYFRSTYSVDIREGWVYRGLRRMFWLPTDLRPTSPTALSAFEDKLVIFTRSQQIVFIDLRPMLDPTRTLKPSSRDNKA